MKIFNSKVHGILDYLTVAFLWLSPTLFGLPPHTSLFAYVLGSIHLVLTLTTRYEMGVVKLVPFPLHGWVELVVSVALLGVAHYLGGQEGILARNFCLGMAGAVFLVWLLSDYRTGVAETKA